jgi:hypothetical protein
VAIFLDWNNILSERWETVFKEFSIRHVVGVKKGWLSMPIKFE